MFNFKTILQKIWDNGRAGGVQSPLLLLLIPCSLIYGVVICLRNSLYNLGVFKQKKLAAGVISVGNITVGGTGKTPMVIMLARLLREKGIQPAVLSRGYGGTSIAPVNIVSDGKKVLMSAAEGGDEPVLIAKSAPDVPVLTGPRRILTGGAAIRQMGANVLILDDAFQHRDVMRDINIVLIDAARPFGNGFLLPAGPLREPLSALERADIIIAVGTADHYGSKSFDRTEFENKIRPFNRYAPVFYAIRKPTALRQGGAGPVYPPGDLKGKKICAFSGIANPAAFKKTLMFLGADVVRFIAFTDHHHYNSTDVKQLQDAFDRTGAEFMVTTEKDAIKLDPFPFFLNGLLILTIEMDILSAREAFEALLLGKLQIP